MKEILTLEEVAELFAVTQDAIRRLVAERKLPFFYIEEQIRFRRTSLYEWAAEREREALSEAALSGKTLNLFRDTLGFFQESQITGGLLRALEQLESEMAEARIRGIAALEGIAAESKSERLPISRVLAAFVRKRAPLSTDPPDLVEANRLAIPTDIQAAVMALTRAKPDGNELVDLRETNLAGVDLSEAHLEQFVLVSSCLDGANLSGCNLEGATLRRALLRGANLSDANLRLAKLDAANLSGAQCERTNFWGAQFTGALVNDANLASANLNEAVGLTDEQIASAVTSARTRLPSKAPTGFNPFKTAPTFDGLDEEDDATRTLGSNDVTATLDRTGVTDILTSGERMNPLKKKAD